MSYPRTLTALFLATAVGAMPLLAQPAPEAKSEKSGKPAQPTPEKTAPAQQEPAPPEQAAKKTPAKTPEGASKGSPFDYHSSEQISEDVPVSFPVDI